MPDKCQSLGDFKHNQLVELVELQFIVGTYVSPKLLTEEEKKIWTFLVSYNMIY